MNHIDETDKTASSPVVLSDEDDSFQSGHHHNAQRRGGKKTPRGSDASNLTDLVTYRDYSRVPPEKHEGASSLIAQGTTAKEPTFPTKLHMILSNPEFQDIISWLPHGRSWRILQQKAFEERVIPLYFRHGRYSSFARQVNGWGFRRITHGSDYNSYYHEMFLRGMPHLCEKMRRLTTKDIGKRKKLDDEPTPDFYSLSRENPLPETAPSAPASAVVPRGISAVPRPVAPGNAPTNGLAEVELALLERRRADLLDRINLLASSNALRQDAVAASLGRQDPNSVLSSNLNPFLGAGGVGGSNLTNLNGGNNTTGLGNLQNPASLNPASLNPGAFNPGSLNPAAVNPAALNPSALNSATLNGMGASHHHQHQAAQQALQRQLMAAGRLPNGNVPQFGGGGGTGGNNNTNATTNMAAQLFAMNNAGFAGMQGLMGNPFGL